jgi:hypothetical protein
MKNYKKGQIDKENKTFILVTNTNIKRFLVNE